MDNQVDGLPEIMQNLAFSIKILNTVDSRYLEIEGTLSKHFEISVLRHIRFVVVRKKQFKQPNFTTDYVI